uniref:Uncharacterized protein n=2 Tax=Oryza TaxID=4527 RepID=A0A0D3EVC1_9ORYZ
MKEINDLHALLAKLTVHPTSDVDLSFLNLLGADTTLRTLLVHSLDPEFDYIHLKLAFLPYGELPLVAIEGPNAVMVLQDWTNAHQALKDNDGWFKSQGMHLRVVSAKHLDTAHSVVLKELKKPTGQQEARDVTNQLELFNELKSTLFSMSLPVKKWLIKELLAGMPHDVVK